MMDQSFPIIEPLSFNLKIDLHLNYLIIIPQEKIQFHMYSISYSQNWFQNSFLSANEPSKQSKLIHQVMGQALTTSLKTFSKIKMLQQSAQKLLNAQKAFQKEKQDQKKSLLQVERIRGEEYLKKQRKQKSQKQAFQKKVDENPLQDDPKDHSSTISFASSMKIYPAESLSKIKSCQGFLQKDLDFAQCTERSLKYKIIKKKRQNLMKRKVYCWKQVSKSYKYFETLKGRRQVRMLHQ